jgi:hypothetical protein
MGFYGKALKKINPIRVSTHPSTLEIGEKKERKEKLFKDCIADSYPPNQIGKFESDFFKAFLKSQFFLK